MVRFSSPSVQALVGVVIDDSLDNGSIRVLAVPRRLRNNCSGNKHGINAVVINENEPVDRKRVGRGYLTLEVVQK